MNILFLTNWYPSTEKPVDGVFIREHARAIAGTGNKVVIIAVNIGPKGINAKRRVEVLPNDEFGIETHIIHVPSKLWKWLYSIPFFTYSHIRNYYSDHLAKNFVPDLIHSNVLYPCAIAGDKLAKKLGKKHIITEHWSGVENFMAKNPFRAAGKRAYNNASAITVVSKFLEKKICPFISNTDKIKIIPNIVDPSLFYFEKKKESDSLTFTAIATWNRYKMPHLFTEALNEISKTSPKKIILNFIGQGEYLEEIKKKKWNFSINYLGNLPRQKVAETLRNSDFFLHASQIETFSVVTAEALLTGTPVIASNVGALPELVNSSNGIITENTIQEWIKSITKAIATNYHNALISESSKNKYSSPQIGKLFNELFETLE